MGLEKIGDVMRTDASYKKLFDAWSKLPASRAGGMMLANVPLAKVQAGQQVRQQYSDERIAELADSIRVQGLLQPVVVRPVGDGFRVVCGHRRFLAIQKLGWESMLALVEEVDESVIAARQLVENIQRENLTPIEEAEALKQWMDSWGFNQVEAARRLGKSKQYISKILSILKLYEKVPHARLLDDIKDREILVSLAAISDEGQFEKALTCAQAGGTRAQVRQLAAKPSTAGSRPKPQSTVGSEAALQRAGGMLDKFRDEMMKIVIKYEAELTVQELQNIGYQFEKKLDALKILLPGLFQLERPGLESQSLTTTASFNDPQIPDVPPAPVEQLPFPGASTLVSISKQLSKVSYSFLSYTDYIKILKNNKETRSELIRFIKSRLPKLDETVFADASCEAIHDYWNALPFLNIRRNVDGFFYHALRDRYNLPDKFLTLKKDTLQALELEIPSPSPAKSSNLDRFCTSNPKNPLPPL